MGLVSTVILARLLEPEDYGVAAMAAMVVGFIEVFGMFGFQQFLIANQIFDRNFYDTAWSLGVIKGFLFGLILIVLSTPAAEFFKDDRLVAIIRVLAIGTMISGLENIGLVNFLRDLQFHRDFLFSVYKKLISLSITVAFAIVFRDYWALIFGTVGGILGGVLISYLMEPFRPRLSFTATRAIFDFSKWLVGNAIINQITSTLDSIIIGRGAGAQALGAYNVSQDLVKIPSWEFMVPATRALFPSYSKISNDVSRLREFYLQHHAFLLMIAWPLTLGLSFVADDVIPVVLGDKWQSAIPILQALGPVACVGLVWGDLPELLTAMNKPSAVTRTVVANQVPRVVCILVGAQMYGLFGIIYGLMASNLIKLFFNSFQLRTHLGLNLKTVASKAWRISCGLAAMAIVVYLLRAGVDYPSHVAGLFIKVVAGGLAYVVTTLILWVMSGRPSGPEELALGYFKRKHPS